MKRREFLATSALVGLSTTLSSKEMIKKEEKSSWFILDEVFQILFPKTKNMPSAKDFNAIGFLKEISSHSSFSKEDKELLFQGAKDFIDAFPEFLISNDEIKIEFIKRANQSSYGQEWLNKVIYYGIEAMLSDPIYGGNTNEIAWKSLGHISGKPQPKRKYARRVFDV